MQCLGGAPHVFLSGYGWRGSVRPRSYRGTRPRFASGTLMSRSDDTAPPPTLGYRRWRAVFSGCALRVSHGRSPQRSKERAERPGDGFPCVGAEETCGVPSQPARRRRTPSLLQQLPFPHKQERKPPSNCRSCPAAHSREREPNAPRSAQPPESNQRQRQPQRCRCAPPARVRPNRQCR